MSNAEQGRPALVLTLEMNKLVRALIAIAHGDDLERIMHIARHHGGWMESFLRDIAGYPEVKDALSAAAPSGTSKERSDVMYEAIDYIHENDMYEF